MSRINKPELVSAVSTAVDLPRTKVDRVLDALIAEIERATEAGATVSIAKFGVFDLRPSAARFGSGPWHGWWLRWSCWPCLACTWTPISCSPSPSKLGPVFKPLQIAAPAEKQKDFD